MFQWLERRLTYKPDQVTYADIAHYNFEKVVLPASGVSTTLYHKLHQGAPVVLFSHGNTGNVTFHTWYYDLFDRLGISYVAYDYPGYGESIGIPSERNLYLSGQAVLQYVSDNLGIAPQSIFHFGLSLGGGVATELARIAPCAGLILECAFTDSRSMAQYISPIVPLFRCVPNRFQNREKLTHIHHPLLVIHGTEDQTVPVKMAQELFDAHPGPHKELYIINDAAHADVGKIGGEEYVQRIGRFLGVMKS